MNRDEEKRVTVLSMWVSAIVFISYILVICPLKTCETTAPVTAGKASQSNSQESSLKPSRQE